jgi:hypothetical protein
LIVKWFYFMIVAGVASQANIAALPCRADTRRERLQNRFLKCFEACGQVKLAAALVKISRDTHYEWIKSDPTYAARFAEAEKRAACTLEDEAVRRAHEGVRRPVLYKGAQVIIDGEPLFQIEYSDRLLMFLLKAYCPEKFRDQPLVTINLGDWNGDCSLLSRAQLDSFIEEMTRRIARKNATVEVQPRQVTSDTKEMGRRAASTETSGARLQQTQAAPPPGEHSVQVVQDQESLPSTARFLAG